MAASGENPRSLPSRKMMAELMGVCLRVCAYAALSLYTIYQVMNCIPTWSWEWRGTNKPWWDKWRTRNTVKYRMDAPDNHDLISGWDVQVFLWSWLPLLVAAICSYLVAILASAGFDRKSHSKSTPDLVRRILAWQVHPRSFWLYWCGGLNVAELLGVAAWIVAHCVGFWDFIVYYRVGSSQRSEIGWGTSVPRSVMYLEWISYSFAWLSFIDFAFLFLPLSHNSFLALLTGLPYSALIRYHRWIGHSTLWMIALHAIFFYMYWIANPYLNFWEEFFDFGQKYYINVLAGSISGLFGLALWVTSLNYVRRNFFEVFYKTHIVGFLGFIIFGLMHYGWMWTVFVPGLALYAADYVTRILQGSSVVTPTATYVSEDQQVVSMELPASKGFSKCPIQDIFLLFPSVSRWQWHPFTIMARKEEGDDNGDVSSVTVAMKTYGSWTKEVAQQLSSGKPVPIRVHGAFDGISITQLSGYDHLVLLGGGIGATPLIALLLEIQQLKAQNHPSVEAIREVKLFWVVRNTTEFSILPSSVLNMASSEPWFSLHLHSTSKQPSEGKGMEGDYKGFKLPALDDSSNASFHSSQGGDGSEALKFPNASPFFWNTARLMQPHSHHVDLLCVILAFVGAFLGLMMSMVVHVEWVDKYYTKSRYWQYNMITLVCFLVPMIGLPMPLVMARHFFLSRKHTLKAAGNGTATLPSAKVQDDGVAYPEEGLSANILFGRPDLQGVLEALAADETVKEVCVYCAGPDGMINSTALVVWHLNDKKRQAGQPHFTFHKCAYEL